MRTTCFSILHEMKAKIIKVLRRNHCLPLVAAWAGRRLEMLIHSAQPGPVERRLESHHHSHQRTDHTAGRRSSSRSFEAPPGSGGLESKCRTSLIRAAPLANRWFVTNHVCFWHSAPPILPQSRQTEE